MRYFDMYSTATTLASAFMASEAVLAELMPMYEKPSLCGVSVVRSLCGKHAITFEWAEIIYSLVMSEVRRLSGLPEEAEEWFLTAYDQVVRYMVIV